MRRIALGGFVMALAAACGVVGPPATTDLGPTRFDTVVLSEDRRSVRVDFAGTDDFDPDDSCTARYEGSAQVDGEELVIGIYRQPHPIAGDDIACELIGYPRSLILQLSEPFTGNLVRDEAGQVLLLGPPDGLVVIDGLPDGWELRREMPVGETTTPRWHRVFSPEPDPWPANGDPMVELIHGIGGPVSTTGGDHQERVEVAGRPGTLSLHEPTGEMVLIWTIGDDEVALVANLADFSRDEFFRLAESVRLP